MINLDKNIGEKIKEIDSKDKNYRNLVRCIKEFKLIEKEINDISHTINALNSKSGITGKILSFIYKKCLKVYYNGRIDRLNFRKYELNKTIIDLTGKPKTVTDKNPEENLTKQIVQKHLSNKISATNYNISIPPPNTVRINLTKDTPEPSIPVVQNMDEKIELITTAINSNRKIEFYYKKPSDMDYIKRVVLPSRFKKAYRYDGGYTLCVQGFCYLRQDKRVFSLSRMARLRIL